MGATRLASGKKPCSYTKYKGSQTALITRLAVSLCLDFRRGTRRGKSHVHTLNKGSQTALITRLAVSFCLDFSDAGRVAPISGSVSSSTKTLPLSTTTKRYH